MHASACSPTQSLPHALFYNSRTSVLYTQRTYFFNSRLTLTIPPFALPSSHVHRQCASLAASSKAKRDFGYSATVSVRQGIDMVVKVLPRHGVCAAVTALACCCC